MNNSFFLICLESKFIPVISWSPTNICPSKNLETSLSEFKPFTLNISLQSHDQRILTYYLAQFENFHALSPQQQE